MSDVATARDAQMTDTAARFRPARVDFGHFKPRHFLWQVEGTVATVTLNRPERKNPLTLESYSELRDMFRDLAYAQNIKTVVITGAGGNFCSGGDVHEIIGPLVEMQRKGDMAGLLAFTRMTGDLVKAMRACPQPIIAAIDGVCAGAGAILAMASDMRYGTPAQQGCVPVRPRGVGRCRYGSVQYPAANYRRGARRRAALYRTFDGRRRGRALGILQQALRTRCRARAGAGAGEDRWPRGRRSDMP